MPLRRAARRWGLAPQQCALYGTGTVARGKAETLHRKTSSPTRDLLGEDVRESVETGRMHVRTRFHGGCRGRDLPGTEEV